jgi:hypothetical protein
VSALGVVLVALSLACSCSKSSSPNPPAPPALKANAYLPNASIPWSSTIITGPYTFQVSDTDLASLADPIGHGIDLVQHAMNDASAPRNFGEDQDPSNRFLSSVTLVASAINCLHRHDHLELHAFIDKHYLYSVALVMIVDANAYKDLNVSFCVVGSLLPPFIPCPICAPVSRPSPHLDPCVGASQKDGFIKLWLGTTDAMCSALGPPAHAAPRDLKLGDRGTDVSYVQFYLNQVGFSLNVDGVFDPATEAALIRFQDCYHYAGSVRGVANQAAKDALRKAANQMRCV